MRRPAAPLARYGAMWKARVASGSATTRELHHVQGRDPVRVAIDVPAIWAWHDHSAASRHAQGCAYATYVGSWKSRFHILEGADHITRYADEALGTARSFCARCGTPLTYERSRAPKIVNLPRALFSERTGREPRYHMFLQEIADWTYMGEPLAPLKGYPGVMRERPRKRKSRPEMF